MMIAKACIHFEKVIMDYRLAIPVDYRFLGSNNSRDILLMGFNQMNQKRRKEAEKLNLKDYIYIYKMKGAKIGQVSRSMCQTKSSCLII